MAEENLNQPNPEIQEGLPDSQVAGTQEPTQPAQPQIDWESDANPYRKRYGDSQSQVQPLVRTLQQFAEYDHTTKAWKPKSIPVSQPDTDFEKILEGYDPTFKNALLGFTQKQINDAIAKSQKELTSQNEYNSGVQKSRSNAMDEFGDEFEFAKNGKMNPASPLYQLANEIVVNKYGVFNPDGTFLKYTIPEAEYLATVEAYAILSKRSKQQTQDKGKLTAIQGKGTKAAGVKKELSYEEYNKLSDSQKDAYDLSQVGGN